MPSFPKYKIGELVMVKQPPVGGWEAYESDISPAHYDFHKTVRIYGPQMGIIMNICKWHAKILLQEDCSTCWLPFYSLKDTKND